MSTSVSPVEWPRLWGVRSDGCKKKVPENKGKIKHSYQEVIWEHKVTSKNWGRKRSVFLFFAEEDVSEEDDDCRHERYTGSALLYAYMTLHVLREL